MVLKLDSNSDIDAQEKRNLFILPVKTFDQIGGKTYFPPHVRNIN